MRIWVAAFLLLSTALALGQPSTRLWLKTTSLPGTDTYEDLVVDSLGNVFICGESVVTATGKYGVLVVKFDKAGTKLWEKIFPGTAGHSFGKSIDLDPNGHVVISGLTNFNPPTDGRSRILKVSAAGALLWDNVGLAAVGSSWYDVAVDSLGESTATGYVDAGAGKIVRTSHYLPNGTLAWSRDYSYPGITAIDQHGTNVVVDSANDIYVAAVNNAFPNGCYNTVVKYNRTSSQLWMRHFQNGKVDYPRGLSLRFGNQPVIVFDESYADPGFSGCLIKALDTNGTVVKTALTGSTGSMHAVGLDTDEEGSIYAGGPVYDNGGGLSSQFRLAEFGNGGSGSLANSGEPDFRAIAAGHGHAEYYFSTTTTGTGSRPATIVGTKYIAGTLIPDDHMFEERIFGSTANGQVPYAIVAKLVTDRSGDLYALGSFSGAQAQDGFIAKYELGPLAQDDQRTTMSDQTLSVADGGYLANDSQYWQAQFVIVSQALHGTFTPQVDGSYTYAPDAGFAGRDRVVYRWIRSNSTVPRLSEANIDLTVYPPLASVSFDPSVKGGDYFVIKATVTKRVFSAMQLAVTFDSGILDQPTPLTILKDRTYGQGTMYAKPTSVTRNTSITVRSGTSQITVPLTITP